MLCWGWIDGLRKGFDDKSFLQRYSPRTKKSVWSQINVDNVARLIKEGRMTEHGLKQVEAAKADGRWDRAYRIKGTKIPADLQAAIDAEPKARRMFEKLSAQNRFALAFRTQNMKTESGRRRKIESFVAMLKRGETIHPQKALLRLQEVGHLQDDQLVVVRLAECAARREGQVVVVADDDAIAVRDVDVLDGEEREGELAVLAALARRPCWDRRCPSGRCSPPS